MPRRTVDLLRREYGDLTGVRVVVLGAAYRGGVKETAFSGVYETVEALTALGAVPVVHDPLYDADELAALGFEPYRLGETIDAAVIQADHPEYAGLTSADLPGVRLVVNGRAGVPLAQTDFPRVVTLGRPSR